MSKTLSESEKQKMYRDARLTGAYDTIWQNVGKCAFCDLRSKYIILEENGMVLTVAVFAYIDGHMMIIPRRHIRSVKELTALEWETARKFMYIAKKMIRQTHGIKGMQIVQKDGAEAQSTVEHLHIHCIPFDAPDLCTWNYRKLRNTPADNAAQYKAKLDKIKHYGDKYVQKYGR